MITCTDAAIKKLRELRESTNLILHVRVAGGGCSGLSYVLEWHTVDAPFDEMIVAGTEPDAIKIATDTRSLLFIKGLIMDYSGGLNGTGFTFENPNAKRTCGCGSSFGV
jgi:iron-sulfur cluster assembly protein